MTATTSAVPRVPSRRVFDPVLGAYLHTGSEAVRAAMRCPDGAPLAIDIETPGLDNAFTINCLTAAWHRPDGRAEAILLDPARDGMHHQVAVDLLSRAGHLILHNAPFDIPPLHHAGLLTLDQINRVVDTLLMARFALPDTMIRKGLEALAIRVLGYSDFKGGMERAFKAAGYKTIQAGYEGLDVTSPIYRQGAMGDTVVTLQLEPMLRGMCTEWATDHPFEGFGATTPAEAQAQLGVQETTHRVMLRRSALGLNVDRAYLDRYAEQVDVERNLAIAELAVHGLEGGAGKGSKLVEYLFERGELPEPWPRTPTKKLKATKDLLDNLDHPLAAAQRKLATIEKVMGYLDKVDRQASVTGRCHPQVGVLGASATGRMCIPTTHGILTSRGVLKWDDVRIGDWTLDMHGAWVQITGVYKYDDQPTVVRTGRNLRLESTAEHRWVSRSEFGKLYVGPINETQRRSIHLAPLGSDFDIRGRSIDALDDGERFAALIGVLVTDGRCVETGNGLRAYVYQNESKYLAEFLRVIPSEAVMYDRLLPTTTTRKTTDAREIRIKTRWLRPRLIAAGLHPEPHLTDDLNLTAWVLGLTLRECAAFLRAGYLGDGITSIEQGQRMIVQRPAAREAFKVAAYRLGYRTHETVKTSTGWGTDPQVSLWFLKRPPTTRHMAVSHSRSDVWCVTTTSGTFTAWDDGPYLTGNSYGLPELQQFPAEARPVICDDGQGLTSIDWSQIEPVTMAAMARDVDFVASYERGEDLYEPIQRSAALPMTKAGRDIAKVLLLATMYGLGIANLARKIGHTEESAVQLRRQMFNAMKRCEAWMSRVMDVASQTGVTITAAGRILPIDAGFEYKAINYCLDPDTRILTADLRHVPAYTVALGDRIVGFDENVAPGKGQVRKLRTAVVEAVSEVIKPSVSVRAGDDETVCSADHLWLVRPAKRPHHGPNVLWRRADALTAGDELLSLGQWDTDTSRTAGYIAGLLDGEGSMTRPGSVRRSTQLMFSQNPGAVMDAYLKAIAELALPGRWRQRSATSTSSTDTVVVSGVADVMRMVGTVRPERFIARAAHIYEGRGITAGLARSVAVSEVRPVGDRLLTSIQTSTRTLVANGLLSHNCIQGSAYDVLAHTIVEMERQGLGDSLHLAMHDEVVVDTAVAEEVQRIMMTPPPFLVAWAQRVPILRTDRADMGHAWAKV